jgi:Flp pilus assembly protein TadD
MPRLAANHSNLGYALCRAGNRTNAEQELRQAIQLDGKSLKAHFLLGVILLDQGTEEARDHLLLAQNDASQARLALAVYYNRLGQEAAAREALKAYLELHASVDSTDAARWVAHAAALSKPSSAFGFPPRENPRQFVDMKPTSRDQIESR